MASSYFLSERCKRP